MLCFRNLSCNALLPKLYLVEKSVHHNVALVLEINNNCEARSARSEAPYLHNLVTNWARKI